MTRYKVILEYDGTDLIGWQENRQGPSVQSIMRDAIFAFCGARPDIVGAGRTKINGMDVKVLETRIEDGKLKIIKIQPAVKKPMDWKSFVNGLRGAEIKYGE